MNLATSLVVKKLWIEGGKVDFIGRLDAALALALAFHRGTRQSILMRISIRIRVYAFKDYRIRKKDTRMRIVDDNATWRNIGFIKCSCSSQFES